VVKKSYHVKEVKFGLAWHNSIYNFKLKYLGFQAKYQKSFEPFIWGICMPNFSPLASMVWEENEVTVGRTNTGCHAIFRPFPIQNF